MPRRVENIAYLDLAIPVTANLHSSFEMWLGDFVEKHAVIEVPPKLRKNLLQINSTDLVAFLGYVDPQGFSEIELKRLRVDIKRQIERQLLKSLSLEHQAHYKWCLAAIKSLAWGRYRG